MAGTLNLANFTTKWSDDFTKDSWLNQHNPGLFQHRWGYDGQFHFGNGSMTLTSGAADGWHDVGFMQSMPTSAKAGTGYGLYQATVSTNKGEGGGVCLVMWPGNDKWPGAEIDLLETVDPKRSENFSTVHWRGSDGSNQFTWNLQHFDSSVPHTYAIDWEPGRLTYYIDGQQIWTTTEHVPLDAAHGGVNEDFGAEVTNAGSQATSSGTSLHLYSMSYSTPNGQSSGAAAPPPPVSAPVTSSVNPATPANTSVGSGTDSLVLKVSQDAYQGNAQYTVSVDGKQVGGTQTAHASHAAGQHDTLTVHGNFGAGKHTVTVDFLNDLYGGNAKADRNLYVDSISANGTDAHASGSLMSNGGHAFSATLPGGNLAHVQTIGSGADSILLHLSQDAYHGNAQYTVSVDGKQVGGTLTASAHHGTGVEDAITVHGSFGSGQHTVSVKFLNDAFGGTGADRNLYVDGVEYKGADAHQSASLFANGSKSFTLGNTTHAAATAASDPYAAFTHNGVVDWAAASAAVLDHYNATGHWGL